MSKLHLRSPLELIARVGYAARGGVFLILGYLTGLAAIGAHTRLVGGKDALRVLLQAPLGYVLLLLIGIGLLCFAVWRALEAFFDADRCGSDIKGLARRAVYAGAALFYLGFSSVVASMLVGWDRTGTGDQVARDWTAWLLVKPLGGWLLGVVGLAIMASGIGVAVAGMRAKFEPRLDLKPQPRRLVIALGVAGFLARAFVLIVVGLFLVFAAVDSNAREATGFAGALRIIQHQPYGSWLLALTAVGFLAFGAFGIAEALFRQFPSTGLRVAQPAWLRV